MGNKVDVSVIYINYNSSDFLRGSIESFLKESKDFSYEFIVVDNSQSKNEATKLGNLSKKYGFSLIFSENYGFGTANNIGAKHANGEYLYFLNCDTKLISNACFELLNFLRNHNECGVAGSNLVSGDLKPNFSFQKHEKNLRNEIKESSLFGLLKKNKQFNTTKEPLNIEGFVSGASMMIRKDLFFEIGGFPEDIFMYAEDSYLCYRIIHNLGLKVYNIPSSRLIHFEGQSFSISEKRLKESCNGNYKYYKLLFGEEIAKRYLSHFIKIYKRNRSISKLLFKKEKTQKFALFYNVYLDKLNKVKNQNE